MSDYTARVVLYSELVNDDNRFPKKLAEQYGEPYIEPRFKTKQRGLALLRFKKHFGSMKEVDKNFDVALAAIAALPVGTLFSTSTLFCFADKGTAHYFGKEFANEAMTNTGFHLITVGNKMKKIYRRSKDNPDLVSDFKVSLPLMME